MKKILSLLPCICAGWLLVFSHAQADAALEKIKDAIAKPEILCGQFNQKKVLAGLKSALNSNGRFCVHTSKGIVWQTLKPFPNTVRLTKNEITQWHGDKVTKRMDAKSEPTIQMINNVLFSLISGDFSQLEKIFHADSRIKAGKWQVALKAHDPGLRKAIGHISLDGDAYVRNISIHEANGDKMHIVFSGIQVGEAAKRSGETSFYE